MNTCNTVAITVCSILVFTSTTSGFRYRQDCECGRVEPGDVRIYGGQATQPHQYPWVVYYKFARFVRGKIRHGSCGGSIINSDYVLTAAHCVKTAIRGSVVVFVGVHDKQKDLRDWNKYKAEKVITHPTHRTGMYKVDIALIKLKCPIKFNPHVRPICLPTRETGSPSRHLIAAGWGLTEDGSTSDVLKHTGLRLKSRISCFKTLSASRGYSYALSVIHTVLCTHDPFSKPCKGDSGGPLMEKSRRHFGVMVIRGINSFGSPCPKPEQFGQELQNTSNVFTKVSAYLSWIDRSTSDSVYCLSPFDN